MPGVEPNLVTLGGSMSATTNTDLGENSGWRIADDVIRLRELGSDRSHALPMSADEPWIVGSAPSCAVQLQDAHGRISRKHARLVRDGRACSIVDLASTNGTWVDGARRSAYILAPGTEISLGDITLIAESLELVALRALLRRMIGWDAVRAVDVDHALRSVRDAATLRAAMILCGDGELAPLAARLHHDTLGGGRPFVVADHGYALPLIDRAQNGTLCFSAARPPRDLTDVIAATRVPGCRVRLVACARRIEEARNVSVMLGRVARLDLPTFDNRGHELPRILSEYADEAAAAFSQPVARLTSRDVEQACTYGFEGLADIEDSARRLVAIRTLGVSAGSARIGITHGALSRWARRRKLVL